MKYLGPQDLKNLRLVNEELQMTVDYFQMRKDQETGKRPQWAFRPKQLPLASHVARETVGSHLAEAGGFGTTGLYQIFDHLDPLSAFNLSRVNKELKRYYEDYMDKKSDEEIEKEIMLQLKRESQVIEPHIIFIEFTVQSKDTAPLLHMKIYT